MKKPNRSKRISKIKRRNRNKSAYGTSARLANEARRARLDEVRSRMAAEQIKADSVDPSNKLALIAQSLGASAKPWL